MLNLTIIRKMCIYGIYHLNFLLRLNVANIAIFFVTKSADKLMFCCLFCLYWHWRKKSDFDLKYIFIRLLEIKAFLF